MIDFELAAVSSEDEQWRQIKDFSRYWISNLGKVYDIKLHKLSCTEVEYDGYILVDLRTDSNELKSKRVHRLVAEAFLSDWNPEWPWTVNHINGIKSDNRLCNLEMLTTQDNSKHYQTAECFAEARRASREAMSIAMKDKCSDPNYVSLMSDRMKAVWSDPSKREMYVDCLYARHADPAERQHISDKMKEICSDAEYRKGMSDRQKKNWASAEYRQAIMSQNQDRVWVHDATTEKWVHRHELHDYLASGYSEGRLAANMVLSTKGKVRISDGVHDKFVDPAEIDNYLSVGWILGRSKKKHVQCIQTGQVFDSVEACAKAFNTNVDLIHSRCKGSAKNFRKLKDLDFRYYEGEDPFADMREVQ